MFKINYRIIEDEDDWNNITLEEIQHGVNLEGFFELRFQTEVYGYYHDRELAEGEEGFDYISIWLNNLLEACILMQHGENYIAIRDIETFNTWLELIPKGEHLFVSEVQSDDRINGSFVVKSLTKRSYPEWKDVCITKDEFQEEVILKTESFIKEALSINKLMVQSRRVQNLQKLLNDVQQSNISR